MYRSILVPLDGSTFAEHALPIARSIARRAGATLQLVRVLLPFSPPRIGSRKILDENLVAQNREQAHSYLNEVVNRLAVGSDFSVTSTLLDGPAGQVAKILNEHITTTGVDLVIMTTHGRGALTRFWLGGVADKLIRHTPVPMLLVRPQEMKGALGLSQEQIFQHVLIPLDGSALSEQILEPAVTLGKLMQADYTLLRVIEFMIPANYSPESPVGVDHELLELLQVDAQTYLDKVAGRLQEQIGVSGDTPSQVRTRIVFNYQPAMAILEEVGQHGIDLIAMETHGEGGLTRLLIGSVADKVLRGTSTPILLHRPSTK